MGRHRLFIPARRVNIYRFKEKTMRKAFIFVIFLCVFGSFICAEGAMEATQQVLDVTRQATDILNDLSGNSSSSSSSSSSASSNQPSATVSPGNYRLDLPGYSWTINFSAPVSGIFYTKGEYYTYVGNTHHRGTWSVSGRTLKFEKWEGSDISDWTIVDQYTLRDEDGDYWRKTN